MNQQERQRLVDYFILSMQSRLRNAHTRKELATIEKNILDFLYIVDLTTDEKISIYSLLITIAETDSVEISYRVN